MDSENMVPSSVTSSPPILSFKESFSWGEYYVKLDTRLETKEYMDATYLEDVGPGTSDTASNALDEARHLGHHVDAIQPGAESTVDLGREILAVGCLTGPVPLDGLGRGPVTAFILAGFCVLDGIGGSGVDDFAVLDNTTDVDLGGAVRRGSGVLHHNGGVSGGLEVDEVPASGWWVVNVFVSLYAKIVQVFLPAW